MTSAGPTSYTYNSSNELTSDSTATFTYDNNGNTISKTTSAGTTNYTWDFENRLTSATLPSGGGTVYFKYDPFGRRIYKSSAAGTDIYVYDGDNFVQELGGGGSVTSEYTQDLSIDEPLALFSAATTSFYHADGLGSIMSLTNGSGQLAASYVYDSFGNLTASTGTTTNPFQYTARELDSETGLYYYRARYYGSDVGRFLSADPIGFAGGENFYRYVYNSPTGLTDATGLSARDVQRIQTACEKCTQNLTNTGKRLPGSGIVSGVINDQESLWGGLWNVIHGRSFWLGKEGCKSQAIDVLPCLDNPTTPYEGHWQFETQPWWGGTHTIVAGTNTSDQNDPVVYCDPWRNISWTAPRNPGALKYSVPIIPPMVKPPGF